MRLARSWIAAPLIAALFAFPTVGSALPLPSGAPTSNNDGAPDLYDVFNAFTGSHFTSNAELPAQIDAASTT